MTVAPETANITTPSERTIVITRLFDAPRPLVFEAWTRAEHVAKWWDPGRVPLAACEIDLRPDGAFRFVHAGPRGHAFSGVYREIDPPSRLVFATPSPSGAGSETVGTLVFSTQGSGTALVLTMECASRADRDALLRMRVDVGTARTLDNLGEYLRGIGGPTDPARGPARA